MSLRTRLIVTVVGLLGIALGTTAGAVFGALQDWSGHRSDVVLTTTSQWVEDWLMRGHALGELSPDGDKPPLESLWAAVAGTEDVPSFFQLRAPDGTVVHTVSLGDEVPLAGELPEQLWPHRTAGPVLLQVEGQPGGDPTQWLVRASWLRDGSGILVAAMPTSSSHELMTRTGRVLLVDTLVALLLVAGVSRWLVARGMRPLEHIAETALAIGEGDLARRVGVREDRTEVGRLASALNAMLGQIEAAFRERQASEDRLRNFVGDASHELRTPVATIRGYAELFRRGASSRPEDLAKAMRRIESEAERIGRLVEELLLLARLDAGRSRRDDAVDLATLAAEAVDDARAVDSSRRWCLEVERPAHVRGDADQLRQVLGNLLGNVTNHTPAGTTARVHVTPRPGVVELSVCDDGPGMTKAESSRVFERFYRSNRSRTRAPDHGGAGLGLSIVAAVAEAHGGSATVTSTPGLGSSFTVVVPTEPRQDAGSSPPAVSEARG